VEWLLRLYPRRWRERYEAEMTALLEAGEPSLRDRLDLVRGAIDAHLHPPQPSIVPPLAAIAGGGLWTVVAAGLAVQPVPADWPGFTIEVLPLASVAAACLLVALVGVALDLGDLQPGVAVAVGLAIAAQAALLLALAGAMTGAWYTEPVGVALTASAVGIGAIGLLRFRRGDEVIGILLLTAPIALLVPTTAGWILFGLAWTAVGMIGLATRRREPDATLVQ